MKLYLTNQHPDFEGRWAVVDADTGKVVHDFATESEGVNDLADAQPVEAGAEWEGPIGFEGIETCDRRTIQPDALAFREMPLPLMLQTQTAFGHDGAVIAGRIDTVARQDGGVIWATGVFDKDPAGDGMRAAELVGSSTLNGVSMDLAVIDAEIEVQGIDEDGWPVDVLDIVTAGELMGATLTPFPAFADARITLTTPAEPAEPEPAPTQAESPAIAASGEFHPPVEYFNDPGLVEPTPLVVEEPDEHGFCRVYGHLALWGECHIGKENACVTAPHSAENYAFYTTGAVHCEDGCNIPTGVITLDTGHADLRFNSRQAAAHYDNTGVGVADVAMGEDEFGPWVAGSTRLGLADERVRTLRASSLSGDWRLIRGSLELVGVLAVNVPGFPIPRARVASGQEISLVASIVPHRTASQELRRTMRSGDLSPQVRAMFQAMQREIGQLRNEFRPLRELGAKELDRLVSTH